MLKLVQCQAVEGGDVEAQYVAAVAAEKGGTSIDVPVRLLVGASGAKAAADIDVPEAPDEEAALDLLADSLERVAASIRARGEATRGIPVYG